MKMLLTSSGIINDSLASALKGLVKRKIRTAFIPTAANVEYDDKSWLINDLNDCSKLGFVDIVDISALPRKNWLPRLKKSNVIVFGGGNSSHLMKCIAASGLEKDLPSLLKNRVYVGISAGSIATAKTIQTSSEFLYGDDLKNAPKGLGFVDFNVRPHLNSPKFPRVNDKNLRKVAKRARGDVYALDDDSAVLVDGSEIKVVSEGEWKLYKNGRK